MNIGEIIIYQNTDGNIKIEVRVEEEIVWLSRAQMALLFGKDRTTIIEHIQNVFKEGELDEKVVCRDFLHTTSMASFQHQKPDIHFTPFKNLSSYLINKLDILLSLPSHENH